LKKIPILFFVIAIVSCHTKTDAPNIDTFKEEVSKAEKDFNDMAANKGIAEAFYAFADSNAIIKRENDTLIKNRESIHHYYSNPGYKNAQLSWKPDFIDVSNDGTLAYTYGKYLWVSKDTTGKAVSATGIFHTVWKKNSKGEWKFVWD